VSLVPKADIKTSKELTASLFFTAVFGNGKSGMALSTLVAVSSFGNMIATIIGASRIIRECGRCDGIFKLPASMFKPSFSRQGVLPYPRFWASTKPFNTPFGPYVLAWVLTTIVIVVPPPGDAFNFSERHLQSRYPLSQRFGNSRRPPILPSKCIQLPFNSRTLLRAQAEKSHWGSAK